MCAPDLWDLAQMAGYRDARGWVDGAPGLDHRALPGRPPRRQRGAAYGMDAPQPEGYALRNQWGQQIAPFSTVRRGAVKAAGRRGTALLSHARVLLAPYRAPPPAPRTAPPPPPPPHACRAAAQWTRRMRQCMASRRSASSLMQSAVMAVSTAAARSLAVRRQALR